MAYRFSALGCSVLVFEFLSFAAADRYFASAIEKVQDDGEMRCHLGVNIDHIATLRQQREGVLPNPLRAVSLIKEAGADGITVAFAGRPSPHSRG